MDKIKLRDLDCFINANEDIKNHPLLSGERFFDLTKLPNTEIRSEMEFFIRDRGKTLSALSMRSDIYPFNNLCNFLTEEYPNIQTFIGMDLSLVERNYKAWIMKKGLPLSYLRDKHGREILRESELLLYLKKVYRFFNENESFHYDSDIWYLNGIPIAIWDNPVKTVKSINFEKITQVKMRREIKAVIYTHLSQKALGTVLKEMAACNRFSKYLAEKCPAVESLHDVNREIIERYLLHTNTTANACKSYAKDLCHLKTVFRTAAKVLEDDELDTLFYLDDIGKAPKALYRAYTDSEIKRLNKVILELDEQIARALFMHEILGTRISEILSLKQNAIAKSKENNWTIRIDQIKTRNSYYKAIPNEVKALFDKSCEYTNTKFGKQQYVFVNEKDPAKAMQYSRVQNQLITKIQEKNLVDDTGKLFGVGTKLFRNTYGKKLAELGVDDLVIARLLGHASLSSVEHYRRIGNEAMSKATKPLRVRMDTIVSNAMGKTYNIHSDKEDT